MSQDKAFEQTAIRLLDMAGNAMIEAASYISDIQDDKLKEELKKKFYRVITDVTKLVTVK
jgi:hypothetical protein